MKEKILVLLAAACISFVSCGQSGDNFSDTKIVRADNPVYDDDLVTVGFVQTGKESDWRDANTRDFLNTFTEENGFYMIYVDGNSSSERQKKAVMDLISQNIDFVVFAPIVEYGWEEVLEKAKQQKTEIIIADRMVSADEDNYLCWVGSDFYAEGIKCGEWLETYLKKAGRDSEKIDIVLIEGTAGASATIGRTAGLMKVIERNPLWNLAAVRGGEFEKGSGKIAMDSAVKETENIDVVIAENDTMIFGAMNSMHAAGIEYGTEGRVITASFDAINEAFEKMIDGELLVSVECNPLLAGKVKSVIEDRIAGKNIEKKYFVEEDVFTYENAAENIASRKY